MTTFHAFSHARISRSTRLATVVVLAAAALVAAPPDASRPASATVPSINEFFVIGVDDQRATSFATWKARGINTVVRKYPSDSFATFDQAAVANGLMAIRAPQNPVSLDVGASHLLAIASSNDEPEMNYCTYAAGRDAQFALQNAADVTGLPFFTNYAGPWILNDSVNSGCPSPPNQVSPAVDYCGIRDHDPNQWCYGEYFRATDWIGFDIYPKNNGNDINDLKAVMNRIDGAYPEGNVKPRIAYVEASNAHCDTTYPNQWHVTYEAVEAVIAGARGIVYFPHGLSGCTGTAYGQDNTTLRIQEEMTRLNEAFARVPGATMNGAVDPADVWFESGAGTNGVIKWGTRKDATHAYYFTENDNGSTAYSHTVRFHGISNCLGKTVTALNDTIVSNSPFVYADRTLTLDTYCQTTVPETWSAYRYKVYKVAIN